MTSAWGCAPEPCYPQSGRPDITSYRRSPDVRTSPTHGFQIDDPRGELDTAVLDDTVTATLDCVIQTWPLMTAEDRRKAWCSGKPVFETRRCLVVQVPPDWDLSPCSGKQRFPCRAPVESCRAKDLEPTPECPCSCRAILQGMDTVLTTPNLELFPARLTELLTGCDQIWGTPLATCGSPGLVGAKKSAVFQFMRSF